MRPSNIYIYPALQRHISRRSASKDNDHNNQEGTLNISCHHLWEKYYKCIENHTTIPSSCMKLHDIILHTYKCPIWTP